MQRHLKSAGILIGFLVASAVAWRLGAAAGEPSKASTALAIGVLAGYLLGTAVTLWGIAYQKHVARTRPAAIWMAFTVSFFAKIAGLAMGPVLIYLVPALGALCDWRSFLVSYGFSALLILLAGSLEVARVLKQGELKPEAGGAALDSRTSI